MGKGTLQVSDNCWAIAPATTNSTKTQACLPGVGSLLAWQAFIKPASLLASQDSPAPELQPRLPREVDLWFILEDMNKDLFTPKSALTTDRVSLSKSSLVNHGVVY